MFDKLLRDQVSESPRGHSAANLSSRSPEGTLASIDSKGNRPASATLRRSSKHARVSSSDHLSLVALASGSTMSVAIPPPHPT
ncbi:UNVERIFIED_CONTAM: hypothetical protein Sradi_6232400 [Sesamum radiatum]|uniref:Uncharacterized protein n=1 Tax=Sesamum radiatum TaxID=300843 RepID=A0AAW2KB94_SESRA